MIRATRAKGRGAKVARVPVKHATRRNMQLSRAQLIHLRANAVVERRAYLDHLFSDTRDTLAPSSSGIRISFSSAAHSSRYALFIRVEKVTF